MRFRVTSLESNPVCIGTYIVEECDEANKEILNSMVDNFIDHGIL
jgi:hypothetical protein